MASKSDWEGDLGRTWGDATAVMDRMLAPFGQAALDQLGDIEGKTVLDLGCGGGESTVRIAERVGPDGVAIGADVSPDLIRLAEEARKEAGAHNVALLCGDAAKLSLGEPADALHSRFGSMFFDAPIDAFARLRAQLKPRAKASMVCWRGFKENNWAFAPFIAAAELLPQAAPPPPGAPGPFAWAKPEESIRPILEKSGWSKIRVRPIDHEIVMGAGLEGDPVDTALKFALTIGPLTSRMEGLPAATKAEIRKRVRAKLETLVVDGAVRTNGACWLVKARA